MATVPTNVPAGKTIQLAPLAKTSVPFNVPANTTVGLSNLAPAAAPKPAATSTPTTVPINVPAGQTSVKQADGSYTLSAPGYNPSGSSSGGSSGYSSTPSYSSLAAPQSSQSQSSFSAMAPQSSAFSAAPTPVSTSGGSTAGGSGVFGSSMSGSGPGSSYQSLYDMYTKATNPLDMTQFKQQEDDLTEAKKAYEMEKESRRADRAKLDSNATSSPVTSNFYNSSVGAQDRNYGARLSNASSLVGTLNEDLMTRVARATEMRKQEIEDAKAGLESFKNVSEFNNPDETFRAYGDNPEYLNFLKQQTIAKLNPLDQQYKQAQIANLQDQIDNRGIKVFKDPITGQQYTVNVDGGTAIPTGGSGSFGSAPSGGGSSSGAPNDGYGGVFSTQVKSVAGSQYLNLADFPSVYQKQAAMKYASDNGIVALNGSDANKLRDASVAYEQSKGVIGELEKAAENVVKAQTALEAAAFGGIMNYTAKSGLSQAKKLYLDLAQAYSSKISKGILGESGALAEGDVKRALGVTGDFKDTDTNFAAKSASLNRSLDSQLQAAVKSTVGTYSNSGGSNTKEYNGVTYKKVGDQWVAQ